jgi:N-acetylmuramoyl-L-alanine amidase
MTKIFINPGHAPNGEPDPGAVNSDTGLRECDVALTIGNKVAQYLQTAGYETQVLQSDSLDEICSTANDWPADLFVSIHCNSAANAEAKGAETFSYYGAENSKRLATLIQGQIVNAMLVADRGIKEAGFYVIKNTNMTAVLVETAFISNVDDEAMLSDPARQDDFAKAVARGITDCFA